MAIIIDSGGKETRILPPNKTTSTPVSEPKKSTSTSSSKSILPIPIEYNPIETALAKVNPMAARQLYEKRIAQEQANNQAQQNQPVEPQGQTRGQVLGQKAIEFVKTTRDYVFTKQKLESQKAQYTGVYTIPALEPNATTYNVYTIGGKEYPQTDVEQRIPVKYTLEQPSNPFETSFLRGTVHQQYTAEEIKSIISNVEAKNKENLGSYAQQNREFIRQVESVPKGSLFYQSGEKFIIATPEAQAQLKAYEDVGYVPEKGVVDFYANPPKPHDVLQQVKGPTTEKITFATQSAFSFFLPEAFAGIQQAITGEPKLEELRDIYASQTLGMLPRKGEQGAIGRQLTSPEIVWDVWVPTAFMGFGPLIKGVGAIGGRLLNIGGRVVSKTPAFIRNIGGKVAQIKDYKNIVYANKTILGKTVTVGTGIKAGVYGTMGGIGAYQIAQDPERAYYTGGKMLGQLGLGYASFKAGGYLSQKGLALGNQRRIAEQWTGSDYESYVTENSRAYNLMESRRGTFELGMPESQYADTIKQIYERFPVQKELHTVSRAFAPSTKEGEQTFILQRPQVSTETYSWEVATPTQEEGVSIVTGEIKPKLYDWKDVSGFTKKTFLREERGIRFYKTKNVNARGEYSGGLLAERPIGIVNRELLLQNEFRTIRILPKKFKYEPKSEVIEITEPVETIELSGARYSVAKNPIQSIRFNVQSDVTLTRQIINTRNLRILDEGRVYHSLAGDEFIGEGASGSMQKGGGQYYFSQESFMAGQESISSRLFPESYASSYSFMYEDIRAVTPVQSGPIPSRPRQREVYPTGKNLQPEFELSYPTSLGFIEGVLGIQNVRRLQGREPIVDFEPVVMQQVEQASMQKVALVQLTKQVTDQTSQVKSTTIMNTTLPVTVPSPPTIRSVPVRSHTFFDNPPLPEIPLPIVPPMPQGRGTRGAGGQFWEQAYRFRKADIGLPFDIDIFKRKKKTGGFAF